MESRLSRDSFGVPLLDAEHFSITDSFTRRDPCFCITPENINPYNEMELPCMFSISVHTLVE